jgi:hypothetical protein
VLLLAFVAFGKQTVCEALMHVLPILPVTLLAPVPFGDQAAADGH